MAWKMTGNEFGLGDPRTNLQRQNVTIGYADVGNAMVKRDVVSVIFQQFIHRNGRSIVASYAKAHGHGAETWILTVVARLEGCRG
jgi:hypothetical protein